MPISNYIDFCKNNIYEGNIKSYKNILFKVFILFTLNLFKFNNLLLQKTNISNFLENNNYSNLRIVYFLFLFYYFPEIFEKNKITINKENLLKLLKDENKKYNSEKRKNVVEIGSINYQPQIKPIDIQSGGKLNLLELYKKNMKGGDLNTICNIPNTPCKSLRDLLENGLEPNHDFGGDADRRSVLGNYFKKYKSTSGKYFYDDVGQAINFDIINKCIANDLTIRHYHNPNIKLKKITNKINIQTLVNNLGSGWENDIFRKFFTNGYFKATNSYELSTDQSPLPDNKKNLAEYMQKFIFFSGKAEKKQYYKYGISLDEKVPVTKVKINQNRSEEVALILQMPHVSINKFIRDTVLSNVGSSELLNDLNKSGIIHEQQLDNVWDSASFGYAAYKASVDESHQISNSSFRQCFIDTIKIFDTDTGLSIGIKLNQAEIDILNGSTEPIQDFFSKLFESYIDNYYILIEIPALQEGYNVGELSFLIRILNLDKDINCDKEDNINTRGHVINEIITNLGVLMTQNFNEPIFLEYILDLIYKTRALASKNCNKIIAEYQGYDDSTKLRLDYLLRILILYSLVKIKEPNTHFKILTRLLLDFKKSGDWGLINKTLELNEIHNNDESKPKYMFLSNDNLCVLFSILCGNPTLFGGKLFEEKNKYHLGIFIGESEKQLTYSDILDKINLTLNKIGCPEYPSPEDDLTTADGIESKKLYDSLDKLNDFLITKQGKLKNIFNSQYLFPDPASSVKIVENKIDYSNEIDLKIKQDILNLLNRFKENLDNSSGPDATFEGVKAFTLLVFNFEIANINIQLTEIDIEKQIQVGNIALFGDEMTKFKYETYKNPILIDVLQKITNEVNLLSMIDKIEEKILNKSKFIEPTSEDIIKFHLNNYNLGLILGLLYNIEKSKAFQKIKNKNHEGLKHPILHEFLEYYNQKLIDLLKLHKLLKKKLYPNGIETVSVIEPATDTVEPQLDKDESADSVKIPVNLNDVIDADIKLYYNSFNMYTEIITGIFDLCFTNLTTIFKEINDFSNLLITNLATVICTPAAKEPDKIKKYIDENNIIFNYQNGTSGKTFGKRHKGTVDTKITLLKKKIAAPSKMLNNEEFINENLGIILNSTFISLTSKISLIDLPSIYTDLVSKMILHSDGHKLTFNSGNFIFHLLRNNIFDTELSGSNIIINDNLILESDNSDEFIDIIDAYQDVSGLHSVIEEQISNLERSLLISKTKNPTVDMNLEFLNKYLNKFNNIDNLIQILKDVPCIDK